MYESCSRSAAPSALMNSSGDPKTFANKGESILILLLCVAAATRVFIFSAAFPFFSNVDEDLHFDLITQYSHGHFPRTFDRLKEETLSWIVPYASPEFLFTPDQFPGAKFPPPLWKQSGASAEAEIAATKSRLEQRNQFRILSAATVLRRGESLVARWTLPRTSWPSITLLDPFPEWPSDGTHCVARLSGRTNGRA